ncbi:hypothetical protein EM868_07420 [Cupriavidus gilardii]|uniref:hypothetical protein n=2 Tax=Cupriavidus gilardii TaxID=82541 RepID=UPI001571912F|nr:hypothetical protein [Cupriavidus gilardii]MCG5259477.1 hypothetical protein [Cupriavidus gilardii]MDF9429625.1 hypothetical protein [Cupriavidus gilardii]NSX05373.1 hypothetical protein [Cupriavidus gilardii]
MRAATPADRAMPAGAPSAHSHGGHPSNAATGLLSSYRIEQRGVADSDSAWDRCAGAWERAWAIGGPWMDRHRAVTAAAITTALTLPLTVAGIVVLARGGEGSLDRGLTLTLAGAGMWLGSCCFVSLVNHRVAEGGAPVRNA